MAPGRVTGFVYRLLLLVFAVVGLAYGQTETGTISGLVTDPAGALVAGAEVQLQSVEQGTVTNVTTNNAGIYLFAGVHPGQYQIEVQKQGFKEVNMLGLIVNVQDHIEQNFRLQLGSMTESITVSAGAELINTTDGTVSTVIDREFVDNLPLNGRSFQTLIQLTPGVVLTATNGDDNGQFSVNGQRASSNYWTVDGVSANIGVSSGFSPGNGVSGSIGSFSALGGTNSLVSVDAMQEFRIQTSTYAPEFGRTPGGQISILTRSGTNGFHGTAFDYFRNDALDANNFFNGFDNAPPLHKAEERQNDFGGTLDGPIFKDKTFFFFSYEGLRLRLPNTSETTVPCDDTCTVFGDARTMAVSSIQPYIDAFPRPNGPEVFTPCAMGPGCPTGELPTGTAVLNASYSDPATLDAYSLRIDHKLTSNLSLFGRYDYSPSQIAQRGPSQMYALSSVLVNRTTTQTGTVGLTWLASPTITNDFRFNYSHVSSTAHTLVDDFDGAVPLPAFPFEDPSLNSSNSELGIQVFSLQQGLLTEGKNASNTQRQFNVVDSVSIQRGSHSLKFGVDYRRLSPIYGPFRLLEDAVFLDVPNFLESGTALEGLLTSTNGATFLFRDLGTYAQDTWRVTPHLTLTYGVRWDINFVPKSLNGPSFPAASGFDLQNVGGIGLAPPGTSAYNTNYGDFAPRLGVAYQIRQSNNWQTVARGGFGLFYDLATSEYGNQVGTSYPYGGQTVVIDQPFPFTGAAGVAPVIAAPSDTNPGTVFFFDPHLKLPYTLEWNVALEQSLGSQQSLSVTYVGAAGRHLLRTAQAFNVSQSIEEMQLVTNAGTSDYDALQVQFQRRMAHGLQALASYTWAHSLDDASAGSSGSQANVFAGGLNSRGNSDFDIRHAISGAVTYDIPSPHVGGIVHALLDGWSIDNIVQAHTAPPVTVDSTSFNGTPVFSFGDYIFYFRPDLVPGEPLYLHGPQYAGGKAFNPAAFTAPPLDPVTGLPLRDGDLRRNTLRGFGLAQWDFAIHRDIPIHEQLKLQFRAEMFNVLNHPNFGQPDGILTDPQFGKSTETLGQYLEGGTLGSGAFSPLYQVGGPRSIQLALKLMF
jgi:hypothetical protein